MDLPTHGSAPARKLLEATDSFYLVWTFQFMAPSSGACHFAAAAQQMVWVTLHLLSCAAAAQQVFRSCSAATKAAGVLQLPTQQGSLPLACEIGRA
jgi:hypothetical protein